MVIHFRRFALLSCIRFEKSINQKCPSSKEEIKIRNCCAYSPKLRNYTLHHFSLIQILRILSSCLVVERLSLINVILYEKKKTLYSNMSPPPPLSKEQVQKNLSTTEMSQLKALIEYVSRKGNCWWYNYQ